MAAAVLLAIWEPGREGEREEGGKVLEVTFSYGPICLSEKQLIRGFSANYFQGT